ncbi:MAG: fatty acid desaturase [Ignavibacteriae bacterium]|nr:fatty acid desaturase [Ignavibacteriota bacterium]
MDRELQQLEDLKRDQILSVAGVPYLEFRKSLTPNYPVVWRDILSGHLALVLTAVGAILIDTYYPSWRPLTIIICAFLFGYIHQYIQLFFHEAAHFNLAKDRKKNDRLANLFIGSLVGQDIKLYRPIHLMHHRHLGTPEDTEHSYFDALTFRFILESLTGIRVIKVLANREKVLQSRPSPETEKKKSTFGTQVVIGGLLNGGIVVISALLGYWSLAIGWTIGFLIIFPFFGSVRQLLEHRSEYAVSTNDYSKISHGQTNRMFGSGIIASTLGAAGFNRHLLHHWEMQISYTRLRDLEKFLLATQAAEILKRHKTGYFRTFKRLFTIK